MSGLMIGGLIGMAVAVMVKAIWLPVDRPGFDAILGGASVLIGVVLAAMWQDFTSRRSLRHRLLAIQRKNGS